VFADAAASIAAPIPADVAGFSAYLDRYRAGLAVEAAAVAAPTAVTRLLAHRPKKTMTLTTSLDRYTVWFVTGSQDLYGEDAPPGRRAVAASRRV
jgi:hypothetical protein